MRGLYRYKKNAVISLILKKGTFVNPAYGVKVEHLEFGENAVVLKSKQKPENLSTEDNLIFIWKT